MRTSPSASLRWTRPPLRDGTPPGAASTSKKGQAGLASRPAPKTPEAKIAKQAVAQVAKKPANRNPSPAEIRRMLAEAADRHGIPREILMAIAYKESTWRHYSRDGSVLRGRWSPSDVGIMQISEKAHPNAFPRARTDMRYNIEYGARYLKYQFERYQNWDDAIAAYNYGSALRMKKSGKLVNQYYLDKVTAFRQHFQIAPDSLPSNL